MIPKECYVCNGENVRRKTRRYVVRRPGPPSSERAVMLCKEHSEPLDDILAAPARGTRHTLKAYRSFAEYQRSAK